MYNSKLFSLLKNLKSVPREILEFENFVRSPYFNSKKEVVSLFLFIKKYWHVSERQQKLKLNKELAYKKVFPKGKEYVEWKMNECISDLSLLLEEFFTIQELRKNKQRKDILLTDSLKNRGIDWYYFKKVALIEKAFNDKKMANTAQDAEFYRNQMWLNEHVYYHPNHHKNSPKNNDVRLIAMSEHLDQHFLLKKLQYICEILSRKKIYGFEYTPPFIEELLRFAAENVKNNPIMNVYLGLIQLFLKEEVEEVPEIKNQIIQLVSENKVSCSLDLLLYFINAVPPIPNRLRLYFEMFQLAVEKNILIENGYISPDIFTNIVHLGCVLGEDKWIRQFKETKTQFLKLDEDSLENVDQLFEAYINFYKGNYRETFIILDQIKLKDMTYGLRRYVLLLGTIIEGKNTIGFKFDFVTISSNFSAYINRKYKAAEISQSLKAGYLIFLYVLDKIYYSEFKKVNKTKLYQKIASNKEVPFNHWLKEKINNL